MPSTIYKTVKKIGISQKKVSDCVDFVLKKIKKNKKDVSVHIVGEKKIKSLNLFFRGIDGPTDVLSFSTLDGEDFFPSDDLGDIFICLPYIIRQAKDNNVTVEEEFFRILIHGILHLSGYDHHTKKEAEEMFPLQEDMLNNFLIKNRVR